MPTAQKKPFFSTMYFVSFLSRILWMRELCAVLDKLNPLIIRRLHVSGRYCSAWIRRIILLGQAAPGQGYSRTGRQAKLKTLNLATRRSLSQSSIMSGNGAPAADEGPAGCSGFALHGVSETRRSPPRSARRANPDSSRRGRGY